MNRKLKALFTFAVVWAVATTPQSLQAATSNEALKAAIVKSKLLSPSIELITTVDPAHADHILVSTFLHQSANDSDCKIDALLIGKVIMETEPDIVSVTVSFFSTGDFSTYKTVSVKSIDIKAFGGGDVGKAELLKNLEIQVGQTADSPANITALLRENSLVKGLQVAVAGKLVELSAQVDLSRGELDTKLEALQLAENALATAPEGITKVNVKLQDAYEPGRIKQISFEATQLASIASDLQSALSGIAIVAAPASAVVAGPFQDVRQTVYNRIKALEKQGVGMQAFIALFKNIEAGVGKDSVANLEGSIKNLQSHLDEQEKTILAVKNRQSQLKKEPEKVAAVPVQTGGEKHADFATLYGDEFDANRAHSDADRYGHELEAQYLRGNPVPPLAAKKLVSGLLRISQILRGDGNAADADKFQTWSMTIRTKYHVQ